jgi:general secretion pathway protein D
VGDILDDTYRVEKIDETRMVLVYLPLGTRQSLPLAGEGAMARPLQPGGSPAEPPGAQDAASLLQLDAPDQVSMGQEFVVNLSLQAGRRASVGVVYDPTVLSAIRRPAPGESTLSDRGRVLVDVVGPGFAGGAAAPASVRFRVIGSAPGTTQIQLEDVTTTHDSDLASLSVPAPRRIFVSSAGGTR